MSCLPLSFLLLYPDDDPVLHDSCAVLDCLPLLLRTRGGIPYKAFWFWWRQYIARLPCRARAFGAVVVSQIDGASRDILVEEGAHEDLIGCFWLSRSLVSKQDQEKR